MFVASIVVDAINQGGGEKRPQATVTIVDDQGSLVGSATVSATVSGAFIGDDNDMVSGDTAAGSGSVLFVSGDTKKGRIQFTFCVDNVEHALLEYDSNSNVNDCVSY